MKSFLLLLFTLCSFVSSVSALSKKEEKQLTFDSTYYQLQDTLSYYSEIILQEPNDTIRAAANSRYSTVIEELLMKNNSFYFGFENVKSLSKITSPDNRFRILCWLYPQKDGLFVYNGLIQLEPDKGGTSRIIKLNDCGQKLLNPHTEIFKNNDWYGNVCFRIIPKKWNKQTIYTLLGWRGSMIQNEKIVDILTFDENENPTFGAYMFKGFKQERSRIIFKYKLSAHLLLQYFESKYHPQPDKPYKKGEAIVFDRLAPIDDSNPQELAAISAFIDGMYFEKGKWILTLDVLIIENNK